MNEKRYRPDGRLMPDTELSEFHSHSFLLWYNQLCAERTIEHRLEAAWLDSTRIKQRLIIRCSFSPQEHITFGGCPTFSAEFLGIKINHTKEQLEAIYKR